MYLADDATFYNGDWSVLSAAQQGSPRFIQPIPKVQIDGDSVEFGCKGIVNSMLGKRDQADRFVRDT